MPLRGFDWLSILVTILTAVLAATALTYPRSEEIPIERCDRLPVVRVGISGRQMRFLVDTGATSMLNVKSFPKGKIKEIEVSSWSGTAATSAREITLAEISLGSYTLRRLKLPAIDLSPIGKACGGQIDGILGVDLLEKMGATIDLKRRIALLQSEAIQPGDDPRLADFLAHQRACIDAFNRRDAEYFENCLDPDVFLFTPDQREVRGRQAMITYLRERYFSLDQPAHLDMRPRDFRVLGEAVWFGYDFSMKMADEVLEVRGMAVCRKTAGRWRLLNMHNAAVRPAEPLQP
jgi:ketosteroid isomerase-like protein/predicted aspartyl protease